MNRSVSWWNAADVVAILVFGALAALHVLNPDTAAGFILAIIAGRLQPAHPGGGSPAPLTAGNISPAPRSPSGVYTVLSAAMRAPAVAVSFLRSSPRDHRRGRARSVLARVA